jgi:hypothetical protein
MKKTLVLYLLMATFLFSCTLEKRRYNRGFNVEWFNSGHNTKHKTTSNKADKSTSDLKNESNTAIAHKEDNAIIPLAENLVNTPITVESSSHNSSENSAKNDVGKKTIVTNAKTQKSLNKTRKKTTEKSSQKVSSAKVKKDGNRFVGYTAAIMALFSLLLIKTQRKRVNRLSRWAKNNPKKAQGAIVGMQLPLIAWATMLGYNFHEMGFVISDWVASVAGAIMALGFLNTPFLQKKGKLTLPKKHFLNQAGYLAITLSSLAMFSHFGNHVSDKYNGTVIHNTISSVDHAMFGDYNLEDSNASYNTVNSPKSELRKTLSGGSCALAIFLIALLSILICAGACAAVFGVVAIIDGDILGLLLILAGAAVLALCIRGIKNLIKWCMPENIEPKEVEQG